MKFLQHAAYVETGNTVCGTPHLAALRHVAHMAPHALPPQSCSWRTTVALPMLPTATGPCEVGRQGRGRSGSMGHGRQRVLLRPPRFTPRPIRRQVDHVGGRHTPGCFYHARGRPAARQGVYGADAPRRLDPDPGQSPGERLCECVQTSYAPLARARARAVSSTDTLALPAPFLLALLPPTRPPTARWLLRTARSTTASSRPWMASTCGPPLRTPRQCLDRATGSFSTLTSPTM